MIKVVENVLDVAYATELYNKLIDLPHQTTRKKPSKNE